MTMGEKSLVWKIEVIRRNGKRDMVNYKRVKYKTTDKYVKKIFFEHFCEEKFHIPLRPGYVLS